jgi:hypothetical protein
MLQFHKESSLSDCSGEDSVMAAGIFLKGIRTLCLGKKPRSCLCNVSLALLARSFSKSYLSSHMKLGPISVPLLTTDVSFNRDTLLITCDYLHMPCLFHSAFIFEVLLPLHYFALSQLKST